MDKTIVLLNKIQLEVYYTDGEGYVTVDRLPTYRSTKNGLMHLGLSRLLYRVLGILDIASIKYFHASVTACEAAPGNYNRLPNCPDESSHDDARGVCAGSKASGELFHKDVLYYGLKHFFVYNNVEPDKFISGWNPWDWKWFAFRLRFIDDISWYFALNFWPAKYNPLLPAFLLGRLYFTSPNYYRMLDYMMIESMALDSWVWRKFLKFWLKHADLIPAMEGYFNKPGQPAHPIISLMVERMRMKF